MTPETQIDPKILAMYLGGDAQTPHRHYPDPDKKSVHKIGKLMDYDLVLGQFGVWFADEQKENLVNFYPQDLKPILRRLSDMTEEEASNLLAILFYNSMNPDDRVTADEIDVDIHKNDDGLMVDGDMALVCELSCRCFEGQLGITLNGTLVLYDEEGKVQRLDNSVEAFVYLLSKSFDLFGLIEKGLAIDQKTLTP